MFKPSLNSIAKMSSTQAILYKSKLLKNGEHPIMIRLIKDRKVKYLSVGHSCSEELWDFNKQRPKKKHPQFKELEINIQKKENEAKLLLLKLENEEKDFSLDEFQQKYRNVNKQYSFHSYLDELIQKLIDTNRVGYANSHKELKRILTRFQSKDFSFTEINHAFLRKIEQFFRERGVGENSMGLYFRTMRAVYNKAIADGFAKKENNPFFDFKVSAFKAKTQKRAITKEDVYKLIAVDVEEGSYPFHAKNFFLFSYYCSGMNFIDVANLSWSDINSKGILHYERIKTGDIFDIKLLEPAIKILDYYRQFKSDNYIFPFLDKKKHTTPVMVDNRLKKVRKRINAELKELAKLAGIETDLTTYVARHTYATVMKRSGVSLAMISEMMGHESEKTTQVYFDSFEKDELYEASKNLL